MDSIIETEIMVKFNLMTILKFTFLALAISLAAFADENAITNAADAAALTDAEFAARRAFSIEGTVVAPMRYDDFVIEDVSGRAYIRDSNLETPPAAGTVVRVTGSTALDDDRNRLLLASCLTVLGKAEIKPPRQITAGELLAEDCDFESVTITGAVVDAVHDDIDFRYDQFVLKDGSHLFNVAIPRDEKPADFDRLLGAEVRVTGTVVTSIGGHRIFRAPSLMLRDYTQLDIVKPVPADPFACPPLENLHHISPERVAALGRRCISGTVLAVWNGGRFFLKTNDGRILIVTLSADNPPPTVGTSVDVVGFPETDAFRINLSRARFRASKIPALSPPIAHDVSPNDILIHTGRPRIDADYQGRCIQLTGVVREVTQSIDGTVRISLACANRLVSVDATSAPECADIPRESTITATGICRLEAENADASVLLPRIAGFSLVTRSREDIHILATPSWWTPARLVIVIGALLALMGGTLVWNRLLRRLVDRRSRELRRSEIARAGADLKVDERTRLAVELHDALSQTLTGVAFQIDAAEAARTRRPEQVGQYLDVARRTLVSCREELRNCLWDLRNNALEEKSLEESIRKTLAPHTAAAEVSIDCSIPRSRLSDNTAHAILCIVRELVVNAIRHGHADAITVKGTRDNQSLVFTVSDNGCGFDPDNRPGVVQGHYGLQGITERINRLNGALRIDSSPHGTAVTFTLPGKYNHE